MAGRNIHIVFMHHATCYVIQVHVPLAMSIFRRHAAAARREKWCVVPTPIALFCATKNVGSRLAVAITTVRKVVTKENVRNVLRRAVWDVTAERRKKRCHVAFNPSHVTIFVISH